MRDAFSPVALEILDDLQRPDWDGEAMLWELAVDGWGDAKWRELIRLARDSLVDIAIDFDAAFIDFDAAVTVTLRGDE